MNRSNKFVAAVHLMVATLLLAIGVRTWVVIGLVAPVTISGSSMVPALRGEYVTPECPRCEKTFDVGGEFAQQSAFVACPRCGEPLVPLAALPFRASDRLWIDRGVFNRRMPRRWEVVVSVCPHDAEQLCTKRVVGLPGESVQLVQGDVVVDGQVLRKSLTEQLLMRQLVHAADGVRLRWEPTKDEGWQWQDGRWQCGASDGAEHWLRYKHLQGQPVTDDSSYNAGVSRRLNRVHDLMVSGQLRMAVDGVLVVEISNGNQTPRVAVHLAEKIVQLEVGGKLLESVRLSDEVCQRLLARDEVELVCSNFDRQVILALDGEVALESPLFEGNSPEGGSGVAMAGAGVSLEGLSLYRDVYYEARAEEVVQLGVGQFYLLGDNAAISIDSRRWGPVPGRLLIGRPLGVR